MENFCHVTLRVLRKIVVSVNEDVEDIHIYLC